MGWVLSVSIAILIQTINALQEKKIYLSACKKQLILPPVAESLKKNLRMAICLSYLMQERKE